MSELHHQIANITKLSKLTNKEFSKECFSSQREYLDSAYRLIRKLSRGSIRAALLSSEDAIAYIAYRLMVADLRFNQGKYPKSTRHGLRKRYAYWGIRSYIARSYTKKNIKTVSLDSLGVHFVDLRMRPEEKFQDISHEIWVENRKRVNFILSNSKLTSLQLKCVRMHYLKNMTYKEIAEHIIAKENRKVTPQAIEQNVRAALKKMRRLVGEVSNI